MILSGSGFISFSHSLTKCLKDETRDAVRPRLENGHRVVLCWKNMLYADSTSYPLVESGERMYLYLPFCLCCCVELHFCQEEKDAFLAWRA